MNITKQQLLRDYPAEMVVCYPEDWIKAGMNSRWLECHRNTGCRPQAWQFLLWNNSRIKEWEKETKGAGMIEGHIIDDSAYDKWLGENVGRKGWNMI